LTPDNIDIIDGMGNRFHTESTTVARHRLRRRIEIDGRREEGGLQNLAWRALGLYLTETARSANCFYWALRLTA
jgi:hypothetical protein